MNRPRQALILFLLAPFLAACTYYIVSFEDVSTDSQYSLVVGLTLISKADLVIYGTNLDSIPTDEIHQYDIDLAPGLSNRYALEKSRLSPGTELTVISVTRCTDCFLNLGPRIKLMVISDSLKEEYQKPIFIQAEMLVSNWIQADGGIEFSDEVFLILD